MRLKCQPVDLRRPEICRLCGQSVGKGYRLKGPVSGYSCEACYNRLYKGAQKQLAFHGTDIFTRSFWRPFHVHDDVVMFPFISEAILRAFQRRLIPIAGVLLAAAVFLDGFSLAALQGIPSHFVQLGAQLQHLFQELFLLLVTAGGHLAQAAAHLPEAGRVFAEAILRMADQAAGWLP